MTPTRRAIKALSRCERALSFKGMIYRILFLLALLYGSSGPARAQNPHVENNPRAWATVYVFTDHYDLTQDSVILWHYRQDRWTTMSGAEQALLKTALAAAYDNNAKVNPFLLTARSTVEDEQAIYLWSKQDLASYDSVVVSFQYYEYYPQIKGLLTIFYLEDNARWVPLASALDTVNAIIKTRAAAPGFYAVFDQRPPELTPIYGVTSYPNPFDPTAGKGCHIAYVLQDDGDVTIRVFTKYGEEVFSTRCQKGKEGGIGSSSGPYLNRIFWDGRNRKGRIVDNGGYVCQIVVEGKVTRYWALGVRR